MADYKLHNRRMMVRMPMMMMMMRLMMRLMMMEKQESDGGWMAGET